MDAAERASAAIERAALKRVNGIYNAALKKALADQKSFLKKIADVDAGRIKPPAFYDTPAKVLAWRQGFTRELLRKEKVIEGIKDQLNVAGAKAAPVIKGAMTDVYATNRTFTAEGIASQVNISFAQYDKRQIDIILNNSQSPFSKIAYKNMGANPAIRRRLQNEMAQATILGESQRDIVKRIREVTGQSKYQATRVAQTERTRIQSQARSDTLTEAEALGVKTTKEWSARMVNTRDTHAALDGKVIPSEEPFVTIDGNHLMYPGDPNGPASEVINCVAESTVIESNGIQAITKSYYAGKLITIKTRSGIQLTASPNHPILTDKGWVGIGTLDKGDNILICDIGKDFVSRVNPNKDNVPITARGLFDFAEIMLPKQRVSGSNVNFHGDVPDGDVEIVSPPRLLKNRRIAMILKIIKNILLKFSGLKRVCLRSNGMFNKGRVGTDAPNARSIRRASDFLSVLKRCIGVSKRLCFGNSPDRVSVADKQSVDGSAIGIELRSYLKNSFPGKIEADDITDVIIREHAPCHLYNLQTSNEMYLANDIIAQSQGNVNKYAIVHNCHCVLIPGVAT
jgi:hypothetical protein